MFRVLATRIRSHLRGAVAPSYLKLAFTEAGGVLTATLTADHFAQPSGYFLGIKTNIDPLVLGRYVEDGDRFKLMPQSLATRAIRGIVLKEERHPPLELPAQSDLHFFRLDRAVSERMWQQVQSEKVRHHPLDGTELDWSGTTFTFT